MQGETLTPDGAETLLSARAPYFKREKENFTSHRYTPSAKGTPYPAVLRKDGVILFGHPIFGQYRQNAPFWCKKLISNAIDLLLGERIVRHDGPSTMTVSVLDQPEERRTNLHILSY
ncbi:MAG: beta-galactosidase, partial [Clostridia bacterium]|nr:beta-galactosidase [Clostridia bacterium]